MNRFEIHKKFLFLFIALLGGIAPSGWCGEFPFVHVKGNGPLAYPPFDDRGSRVPDFSYCGYMGGGITLPNVPVKVILEPDSESADDRARIQAAIDQVSGMPMDENGFRGAVLLKKGEYRLSAVSSSLNDWHPHSLDENKYSLLIAVSGVVLRGEGDGPDGTVLRATAKAEGTLIMTSADPQTYPFQEEAAEALENGHMSRITDAALVRGFNQFAVDKTSGLAIGDEVFVCRNTNMKWVKAIGADQLRRKATEEQARREPDALDSLGGKKYSRDASGQWWWNFPWKPEPRETYFRTITGIDGNRITINIPIPEAFSEEYGGGFVFKSTRPRCENIGFENFRIVTDWEADESGVDTRQHFSEGIELRDVKNTWVRNISGVNLFGVLVRISNSAFFTTVQDCYLSGQPAETMAASTSGYYGGGAFAIDGQMALVQRCLAEHVRHYGYTVGAYVAGPNVILDCDGRDSSGCAETHQRWATGILWDRMGHRFPTNIGLFNRMGMGSGHGWTADNSLAWNCVGTVLQVESPPLGQNFCVGGLGTGGTGVGPDVERGRSKSPREYYSEGQFVSPRSLYLQQLQDRLGVDAVRNVALDWQIAGRYVSPKIVVSEDDNRVDMYALEPKTEIHYTLDGSEPNRESPSYKAPLSLGAAGGTVKAVAIGADFFPSAVSGVTVAANPFIDQRGEWLSKGATYSASRGRVNLQLLNGEDGESPLSFYTGGWDTDPYIIITLPNASVIQGMIITARQHPDWPEKTKTITAWVSRNGSEWTQIWQAAGPAYKWTFLLPEPERARYVKIGLIGDNKQLCLKNVRIYGRK
ncbi:MAG: FN3 associated domain-containing protein [Kiritimatiellales bacterium]